MPTQARRKGLKSIKAEFTNGVIYYFKRVGSRGARLMNQHALRERARAGVAALKLLAKNSSQMSVWAP